MGYIIFRRIPFTLTKTILRAQKVLYHNKSFIYKRISCLDATADSDYAKQKGSTTFLTVVEKAFKKIL